MLITVENETKRLEEFTKDTELPYVVVIYASVTSRRPVIVRRKTVKEALRFVEEYTGTDAHRWVKDWRDYAVQAFTGTHQSAYKDTAQYKPGAKLLETL